MYSDYTDRAKTNGMLLSLIPVKNNISNQMTLGKVPIVINPKDFSVEYSTEFFISPNGVITVQGGDAGQMLVLIPTLEEGEVTWRCIGGPYKMMGRECQ